MIKGQVTNITLGWVLPDSSYFKILIISPGVYLFKRLFAGLIFGGAYFRRGLLSEGILRFKMGMACQ